MRMKEGWSGETNSLFPGLVYRSINVYSRIKQKKMNNEFLQTEEAIVAMLKTVYDPEIPVNVYDLGLIYKVDIDEEKMYASI